MTKEKAVSLQQNRPLDAIVLGRAGVDLYAQESNTDMVSVSGFNKFVGGSAANIAIAISKLGGKVGFIGCISSDSFGDYVNDYMRSAGIDLSGMITTTTHKSRTSVAFTEMKPDHCNVLMYRNHASDLMLEPEHISEKYIASAKVLVVTGTALAKSPSREATLLAIDYARRNSTLIILDLDYRPYSWRTELDSSIYYGVVSRYSDIIVGNKEEFNILKKVAGQSIAESNSFVEHFMTSNTKVIVVKSGNSGCTVYQKDGYIFHQDIFKVHTRKPFGSGDAFLGALIWTLIKEDNLEKGVRNGSAAAAINVSSNNCTESMPNEKQLSEFIKSYT